MFFRKLGQRFFDHRVMLTFDEVAIGGTAHRPTPFYVALTPRSMTAIGFATVTLKRAVSVFVVPHWDLAGHTLFPQPGAHPGYPKTTRAHLYTKYTNDKRNRQSVQL